MNRTSQEKIIKRIDGICPKCGIGLMEPIKMHRNKVDIHIIETKQGNNRLILALRADLEEDNIERIVKATEPTMKEIKIGFVYGDGSELQLSKIDIDAEDTCHVNDIDGDDLERIEKELFPLFSRV